VQNLSRLNETVEEDAVGVQQTFSLLENMIELDASLAVKLCEKTHILQFLLERVGQKDFDANKLSASELLDILLQAHTSVPVLLGALKDCDGMELLLQAMAVYRKKEVTRTDEQV
jgi:hypothetical protein